MSGIIAQPVLYSNANTGLSFTSTDSSVITLTYEDITGGAIIFGGGFLVNAQNVSDGSPANANVLGDYVVLENRPVVSTSGAVSGWVVTIESRDPLGWFGGSTDYLGGLSVFVSTGQLSYTTYSK